MIMDAFADEYGDASIKTGKRGVTDYFIVTAILVPDALDVVRAEAERIRKLNFQTGEMKSSGVGDDDGRRVRILREIALLPIKTYSLAVDKREIYRDSGLAFKRPFFKYINRKLYKRLFDVYREVRLIADEHGTEEFMLGFKSYFDRHNLKPDLFATRTFDFENSKSEVMLQIADFVSGSLARCIDPLSPSPMAQEISDLLGNISLGVELWPPRFIPLARNETNDRSPHDQDVREYCLRQAIRFIQENEGNADETAVIAQVETLRLLLFKAQFDDENKFISTKEILTFLKVGARIDFSEHQIRSAVIAKLRDANVIVAGSSAKKGYKLPIKMADIADFLNHTQTIVPPMLARIAIARNDLLLATSGKIDILDSSRFQELKLLVAALDM